MRKLIISLLIFITIVNTDSYAQENELQGIDPIINNITPQSPEAAAFEKYVDMPVSYYTGVPNISIPIANLKGKNISIPVSLSYHASGIKVEETATWVGLGWSLNAEGIITRTLRGNPDEQPGGYSEYDHNFPDPNILYDGFATWSPDLDFQVSMSEGNIDLQPDEFTFNFMGYSGKFYIYNNKVYTVPRQNFQIEYFDEIVSFNGSNFNSLSKFIITTNDGIKYYFGKSGNNVAYDITSSENQQSETSINYTSSWYLSKITAYDTDIILFNYTQREELLDDRISQTISYFKDYKGFGGHMGSTGPVISPSVVTNTDVYSCKLTSITSASAGSIYFSSSEGREDMKEGGGSVLNEISVKDNLGREIKSFDFKHSYYNDNKESYLDKRLKLTALIENNSDKTKNKTHFFQYNNNSLPSRDSKDKDSWGYYNNKGNTTILPEFYDPVHQTLYPGADKSANPDVQEYGILKKIIYPTGGSVKFEYEPNDYGYIKADTVDGFISEIVTRTFTHGCITTDNICQNQDSQEFRILKALDQIAEINIDMESGTQDPPDIVIQINGEPISNYDKTVHLINGINTIEIYAGIRSKATVTITFDKIISPTKKIASSGLRIKSVKYFDKGNNTPKITKEYSYTTNNPDDPDRSSGVLIGTLPSYYRITKQAIIGRISLNHPITAVLGVKSYYTLCSDNIFELSYSQGKHITYKQVKEKTVSNNETGYTIYKYNYTPDIGTFVYPYTPIISNDWKRGLLQKKSVYDTLGNKKLEEFNEYNYHYNNDYVSYVPGAKASIILQGTTYRELEIEFLHYNYRTEWVDLNKKTIDTYFDGSNEPHTDTIIFKYDNLGHMLLTEKIRKSPGEKDLHTKFKYPGDYSFTICDDIYNSGKAEYDTAVQTARDNYFTCLDEKQTNCVDPLISCKEDYQNQVIQYIDCVDAHDLVSQDTLNYYRNYIQTHTLGPGLDDIVTDLSSIMYVNCLNDCQGDSACIQDCNFYLFNPCKYLKPMGYTCDDIYEGCLENYNCLEDYQNTIYSIPINYVEEYNTCLLNNVSGSPDDVSAVINMRLKNMQTPKIETTIWKKNTSGNLELINGTYSKYHQYSGMLFLPVEVYNTENLSPVSENNFDYSNTQSLTFNIDDSYVKKGTVNYDQSGNIIQYQKENDVFVSLIWSNFNSSMPVIIAENIKHQDLQDAVNDALNSSGINSFMIEFSNPEYIEKWKNFNTLLRNALPEALVSTYTFIPNIGISSETKSDGKTNYYEYNNFNQLMLVRDQDYNIINHTKYNYHTYAFPLPAEKELGLYGGDFSFEIMAQGDWTMTDIPDWLTLSSTTGTDNAIISGNCASSDTARNEIFHVQCGEETSNFSINQVSYISINPGGLSFMNSTSESQTILVGASGNLWELSSDVSWLSFSPESSSSDYTNVTVRCTQLNPQYDPRTATITVTAKNESGEIIEQGSFSVTQAAAEVPPGISGHVYDKWGFPIENVQILVNELPVTATNSSGYYFFEITGGETTITAEFEDHIFSPEYYFYSNPIVDITDQNFQSDQETVALELTVFPESLYFAQDDNLSKSFSVICNLDYQVISNNSWITINEGHFGMKTVTCDAAVYNSREGSVSIHIQGSDYTFDIPIIQEGSCTGECGDGCTWDPLDCRCEDENGDPTCNQ